MKKHIFYISAFLYSCANIVPPTGGNNDTIGPKIIETIPANGAINFNEKELIFAFDEFVNLNDPGNNIEIYPNIKKREKIIGKKLHIFLEEKPAPNTTYLISFTDAVKDFHENNPMQNHEFVFATGPKCDSGRIDGFTLSAARREVLSGITCVLAENRDSFTAGKFLMKAISDDMGRFTMKAIKENKKYALYGFIDVNKDKKWSKDEEIGFLPTTINTKNTPAILINKSQDEQKITKLQAELPGIIEIMFATTPEKVEISLDTLKQRIKGFEKIENKIRVFYDTTEVVKDNIKIQAKNMKTEEKALRLADSKGMSARRCYVLKSKREEENKMDLSEGIKLVWSYPILKADSQKILIANQQQNQISIQTKNTGLNIKGLFQEGKEYTIIIKDSAVQNIFYQYNKADTIKVKTAKKQLPSTLTLQITDLIPEKNYILYCAETPNRKKQEYIIRGKRNVEINQKNLTPETYKYYLVEDENANGKWDMGDFEKNQMPENVYVVWKQKVEEQMDYVKTSSYKKLQQ